MRSHATSRRVGFSLIELVIVVVIIGIIAAIAAPRFSSASTKTSQTAALATFRDLSMAYEVYYQQHGDWPVQNTSGKTDTAMNDSITQTTWSSRPPLGERWVFLHHPDCGVCLGMAASELDTWVERWQAFDARYDDGDSDAGVIRIAKDTPPALVWIVDPNVK
ncbi:MAG: prepilin-type N-terminal cleavage/methylation domain-containing protein [Planctomycetes bacterium]|nr:prepilin-type N-terminal cleavage/methylation domain-containing protein [Planctomycetota bacterium]